MTLRIGIDVGGTKIEGIALAGRQELARLRLPTPRDDYEATVGAIVAMTLELENRWGGRGTVGVGIPGTISPETGLVKNANSVWLIGRPLLDDLRARLDREVRIANDANCFTVSEAADGAAAGAAVVFGVILGTGTGAGIVVHGAPLTGANAIAGEWGHTPLPWADESDEPAPECYCGKRGCIETYLAGPALSADHERHTGDRTTVPEIIARADTGDRAAAATLGRYVSRAARGLAAIINVLDPDVIVVGGGLSNIDILYDQIPRLWGRWVFAAGGRLRQSGRGATRPKQRCVAGARQRTGVGAQAGENVRTRLVRARHGDSSGVRGAAWLWPDV